MLLSMGSAKPRLVLLGPNGMLGHALQRACTFAEITPLSHADLDITNQASVLSTLTALQPDMIVNAAAYTKVDDCETNTAVANRVNGEAVGYLAQAAKQLNATFVHYSTDYVFSGHQATGYHETDQPDVPVNAYGHSKLLGERRMLELVDETWNRYYLIRTAWLFGPYGNNFVDTMLKLANTTSELKVVNDQYGSPTYSQDLATATADLLSQQADYGVYHLTNSGTCTWYEFACEIFKQTGQIVNVTPCTSAEFPRPAQRPMYSILVNTKCSPLPSWQQALATYLAGKGAS